MSAAPIAKSGTSWKAWGRLARFLVAGLFIFAAVGKIADPAEFAKEIREYELAPPAWTNALANVLPWLELAAAGLLLIGFWRGESRFLIFAMLLAFTGAKISAEVRGLDIICGCFGGWSQVLNKALSGPWGIVLNIFLLSMVGLDFHSERRLKIAAPPKSKTKQSAAVESRAPAP